MLDTLQIPQEFQEDWSTQQPLTLLEDGDRRTFEGWAHVDAVDMQGMYLPLENLQWSLDEYMRTNPVVLWLHNGRLPIGMITKLRVVDGRGVYVRGHIVKHEEIASKIKEVQDHTSQGKNAFLDIAKTADQVWNMLCRGLVRSLSIGAYNVGKQWEERFVDGVMVKVPKRIRVGEISLAPIAQNRGAQLTAANYLAKGFINENEDNAMEELVRLAMILKEKTEKNGGELPEEEREFADELFKAFGLDETPEKEEEDDTSEDINELKKALADQSARLAAFEAKYAPKTQDQGLAAQKSQQTINAGVTSVQKPGNVPDVDGKDILRKGLLVAGKPALAQELGINVPVQNPTFQNDMMKCNLLLGGRLREDQMDFANFSDAARTFLHNVKAQQEKILLPKPKQTQLR